MNTQSSPRDISATLLRRSVCVVQVAAVLSDKWGVHSWGWNSSGPTGYGLHAEAHCLQRANRKRVAGSTLYVAARRRRNGRIVTARPCPGCQTLIKDVQRIIYRDENGVWCDM